LRSRVHSVRWGQSSSYLVIIGFGIEEFIL